MIQKYLTGIKNHDAKYKIPTMFIMSLACSLALLDVTPAMIRIPSIVVLVAVSLILGVGRI